MRISTEIRKDLNKSDNFFRTIQLLRETAENYRATSKDYDSSVGYSSILEHYNASNINNGSGRYVIVL